MMRKTGLRFAMSLLLMLVLGVNSAWGQTDYSGVYYIANAIWNGSNTGSPYYWYSESTPQYSWYLVPAADPQQSNKEDAWYSPNYTTQNGNPERPFLTTYRTSRDNNSIWIVKKTGTLYYIIHALTGKYVKYEPPYTGNNIHRKAIHLEAWTDPDNDPGDVFKYEITTNTNPSSSVTGFNIKYTGALASGSNRHFNPAGDNWEYYHATNGKSPWSGGMVGLYSADADNIKGGLWPHEDAKAALTPTISDVNTTNNTFTITCDFVPTGCSIVYTTDGTNPSISNGTTYSSAVSVTESMTVKAAVVGYGMVLSNISSKSLSPVILPPTVTNNNDGTIALSTTPAGATIYYTTNGDTPDNTSTEYASAFSLGDATVIKAIAYLDSEHSEVTTYNVPQYTAPTISFNSSTSQVTITSEGKVYYNTGDGSQADPTTSSTLYSAPFTVSSGATIKAIATHAGYLTSTVAELAISQVATPIIQDNGNNTVSITCTTAGTAIYYTIDGTTPNTSSTLYTGPLTDEVSGKTINAIAVKANMIPSAIGTGCVTFQCAKPVITKSGENVTITCDFPSSSVSIYYTINGGDPTSSSALYSAAFSVNNGDVIKAIAIASGFNDSPVATKTIHNLTPTDGKYLLNSQSDFETFVDMANEEEGASYHYVLKTNVDAGSEISQPFTGIFEADADENGNYYKISGLRHALFNTINGGTVKNVILSGVNIPAGGSNVGAIANEMTGTSDKIACIYNCGVLSGSVNGSGYVGGLVGLLGSTTENDKCYARVINCYSYADIESGSEKAGIVGHNSYASKYNDLKTMVMNCMFYGDISTTSGSVYPIYGGHEISNDYKANTANRLNNYNYFLYEAPFSKNNHTTSPTITAYNCALAAEERFLVRFEFYRHLLNSNRELAAWYVTGNAANGKGVGSDNKMLKWVLDKSIAPYPILKVQGKYPSVVNYDEVYTFKSTGDKVTRASVTEPNQGGIVSTLGSFGSLTINIQMGSGGAIFDKPSEASITTSSLERPIIDKDFNQYNFNYGKVQLPYYNEVGTKNYTGNRVVTGWKIVSMTSGTAGGYTETNYDAPNYNYADRDHYGKDIYTSGSGNSGRIFAQGAYFNVPTGVTAITIEPYWAKCAYLSNKYYDRYGYNTTDDLSQIGGSHYEADTPTITIDSSTQNVYTTLADARHSMGENYESGSTVYDYAIVLVGNYHHHTSDAAPNGDELNSVTEKPLTITSVDLNKDNEPDYCLIFRSGKQKPVAPIRYDFITLPGMAMAMKMATHTNLAIPGNCKPFGWFEVTTTGLIKFGQFEHSWEKKTTAPLILMGGVIDQFVSTNSGSNISNTNKTNYILLGDNVWFLLLSDGIHSDQTGPTPHRPISITGGEYETLYLSGYFRSDATACTTDYDRNAKCYIDGGKFGEVAGAGQEKIDGNVTWIIDHADIDNFYGGGINSEKAITGNIHTTIKNSRVDVFCGGPKFGNMASTKTVITEATGCTFRKYFGAGYGGTAILRERIQNEYQSLNYDDGTSKDWAKWISDSYDNSSANSYRGKYITKKGVSMGYEYEFFGGSAGNVARLYIDYASFSLAQTNSVTSTLTGCTIKENFYGGGSLGAVVGDAISTLTNCTVLGNVFGAGYSVDKPTVTVRNTGGWSVTPYYNNSTAIYEEPIWQSEVTYTWDTQSVSSGSNALVDDGLKIKTKESLEGLGAVTGNVTLTLNGTTNVTGNVYGGGEASAVKGTGNTITVNLQGDTEVSGNVYGGGDQGLVEGSTTVNVE